MIGEDFYNFDNGMRKVTSVQREIVLQNDSIDFYGKGQEVRDSSDISDGSPLITD